MKKHFSGKFSFLNKWFAKRRSFPNRKPTFKISSKSFFKLIIYFYLGFTKNQFFSKKTEIYIKNKWEKNSFFIIGFVFLFISKIKEKSNSLRFRSKLKKIHFDLINDYSYNYINNSNDEKIEKKINFLYKIFKIIKAFWTSI